MRAVPFAIGPKREKVYESSWAFSAVSITGRVEPNCHELVKSARLMWSGHSCPLLLTLIDSSHSITVGCSLLKSTLGTDVWDDNLRQLYLEADTGWSNR